jgi:hypothetical protein
MWRVTMDEITFLKAYNSAVSSASEIIDLDVKATMMQILQLINGLSERMLEMQAEEEDEGEEEEESE